MNNYIRTKNGIYDLKNDSKERIFSLHFYNEFTEKEFKKLILKQADTIEELCDEFILDNRIIIFEAGSKKYFYYLGDDFDFFIDEKIIEDGIYGAIWTSKGLIYVAKMNEKGELELI